MIIFCCDTVCVCRTRKGSNFCGVLLSSLMSGPRASGRGLRTVAVDLHAFLDAVEAERASRLLSPASSLHSVDLRPFGRSWCARGDSVAETSARVLVPASVDRRPSSSRSIRRSGPPSRVASVMSAEVGVLEVAPSSGGGVRETACCFAFDVSDAVVDEGADRRRTLFVLSEIIAGNRVLDGLSIARLCLLRHCEGALWEDVVELRDSLLVLARAEARSPAAALALLR